MQTQRSTDGSVDRSTDEDLIDRLERLFLLDDAVAGNQPPQNTRQSFWTGVGVTSVLALSVYLVSQNASNLEHFYKTAHEQTQKTVTQVLPPQLTNGLSATRTTLTGVVDPDSMTAAYYLSTILKNSGNSNQEAQMKIVLPAGAAVTRATLWINGQPQEAAFTEATLAQQAFDWVVQGRRDPLLVKQINENTIQVTASPVVPGGDGMKIRIGITAPLNLMDTGEVSAQLPLIKDRNFGDGKYDVHLESANAILSASDNVTREGNINVLRRNLNSLDASQPRITFGRSQAATTFAARQTHSIDGGFIVATWQAGDSSAEGKKLVLRKQSEKPAADVPILKSDDAAARLSTLWAKGEIQSLIGAGDSGAAVRVANVYRVVSPVSSAVVLETQADYDRFALNRDLWQSMATRGQQKKVVNRRRSETSQSEMPALKAAPSPEQTSILPVPVPTPLAPSMPMADAGGPGGSGGVVMTDMEFSNDKPSAQPMPAAPVAQAAPPSRDDAVGISGVDMAGAVRVNAMTAISGAAFVVLLFALGMLNWTPVVTLFARAGKRLVTRKPGAAKLFMLAGTWLALAVTLPVVSQLLAVMVAFFLVKRRQRQHTARRLTRSAHAAS